ncbi:ABC transporter, substrate binding protein, PQQ-dependent alcohol dehydrogenase system [Filomicrobium insigne]|uniref:ABC transporter, substrate binding protein, PQQ-dependent alcohol dehydrogenase system n=1 Tax=Filomicrobium insigne TaxID=418854 RepID=A0A1H0SM50_9HYPH|nr:ABC transporter substrate-binding protein [Filomicrobium insigne]SDP42755.1 ABC transporter, substrate binding protein, PQQ-dependent alcohol dehydrogenase system [Filomicrobium insigne]
MSNLLNRNIVTGRRKSLPIFLCAVAVAIMSSTFNSKPVFSQEAPTQNQNKSDSKQDGVIEIPIAYLREKRDRLPPLSLLDFRPDDDGIAGAQLAVDDNNTTGRFLKQSFRMEENPATTRDELIKIATQKAEQGLGFFVVDVTPDTLLALSDALKNYNAVIFNAGATDDRLRQEDCRLNVKHTAPSRAMLTDALIQYLAWKRWRNLVLISGPQPNDQLFAASIRHSAKRFGLKILEDRTFKYEAGSRRADGGYEQVQQQIPSFTQDLPDYDVLIVADESKQFGDYFPYRTWIARPVAGTQGLYPTSWHPASELWGATQFQNRFQRKSGRVMRPLDYAAWMAVRSIGEAATRTNTGNPKTLIGYMLSDRFELAAFKGQKLTYRPWNAQLRQPLFVATDKIHVSVSPQPGFLHQVTELDTLGIDRPETKCTAFTNR